jgi:hypothetical protein
MRTSRARRRPSAVVASALGQADASSAGCLLEHPRALDIKKAPTADRFEDDAPDTHHKRYVPYQWRREEPAPLAVYRTNFLQHTPSPDETLVSTIDVRPHKLLPWRKYREEMRIEQAQQQAERYASVG